MTRVTVVTGRQELRVGVVGPDVCGLHTIIPVLTVSDCVTRKTLHPGHLSTYRKSLWFAASLRRFGDFLITSCYAASRVLDKPILWRKLPNKVENVCIYFITEIRVIADRVEISGSALHIELFKGLQNRFLPRKCDLCGRYFVLERGFYSNYCKRPVKGQPDKCCRDLGHRKRFNDKLKTDPIWSVYHKAYKAHAAGCRKEGFQRRARRAHKKKPSIRSDTSKRK